MLSDRIVTVLDRMHVTISDVARAGGCTPSNLNRIKNGVRVPSPSSPTIGYLTNGLIEIARQRNQSGELASLCGAKLLDSEDVLRAKLIQWLYEDTPAQIRTYRKHNHGVNGAVRSESWTPTEFSKRLDLLMKTAEMSNRRLGREADLDPSYISRLRRLTAAPLIKAFRQRDRALEEKKSAELYYQVSLPISDELYLLQKYRWLILANHGSINYHSDPRMDPHFHCLMNTYDYEASLFRIAPRLKQLRDWKELYIQFNSRNAGHPLQAGKELEDLIDLYYQCGDSIFVDFASLLSRYKEPIINSFVMVEKYGTGGIYDSRLSNGPIESLNRKVKDLKRLGRGFRNFEHFRNRFLYATRNNPTLNAIPEYNPIQYGDIEADEI